MLASVACRFASALRGLESRRLLGTPGRIARAVGVGTRSGELPALHDQVFIADRSALEPTLEDLAHARRISRLRGQRRAGDVWGHGFERHGSPRVIARRRLREPHVTGVTCELSAPERTNDGIAIADLAACGVHDISAALHLPDQCVI